MRFKFEDIEMAFDFVSSAPPEENAAVVRKDTGQILWHSDMGDSDDIDDEDWNAEDAVAIPHKTDLELGRELVFDFVRSRLPEESDRVHDFFSHRGAYGRFKNLLASKNLLDAWYAFEAEAEGKALRQWCADEGIELED
jgi:hypothetical protein